MLSFVFAFFFLLVAPFALATPNPAPSATPYKYSCPPQDQGLFDLGPESDSGGVLTCLYPAFPGETSFYCTYNDTTGALINDFDAGVCPETAVKTVSKRSFKGTDNLTALRAKKLARAAQPLVDGAITDGMKKRSHLHKNRVASF